MAKFIKSIFEKLIEGILFLSSTITTMAIVLIIVFLFKEGIGTFNQTPIEEGFSLIVNKNNSVNGLSAMQIKDIFDQNITNWKTVGGKNDLIILFNIDNIGELYSDSAIGQNFEYMPQCLSDYTEKNPGAVLFVATRFVNKDFTGKILKTPKITISEFLSQKEWFPTAQPAAQLGVLPLILGTLWVSLGAILIALPLGFSTAIYMAEIASPKIRNILKPLVELLAGIPSVVYGFFGLVIIVPGIQKIFDLPVGETALAGSIVLGIMALPTIITISEDALRTSPKAMKEASLALGANKWQTIYKVIIPYSSSGITAAAILGIGRAIGETMAVLMVTGNAAVIPHSFLEPVRTIPATIAAELGEAPQDGLHYKALFALGCILFIITMAINLFVGYISSKKKFTTK